MKKTRFRLPIILAAFFVLALLAVGMVSPVCSPASAESVAYSAVIDDLKKDSAFRESEYPAKAKDYSLQVIQIAESVNKELFVYVYQPSAEEKQLTATSISISTTQPDNPKWHDCKLIHLNAKGVFAKYKIANLTVRSDSVRHYDITEIFRAWDKSIDQENENGNVISEVPYKVGKYYKATTENGKVSYECRATDTRQIVSKYCGYLRPKEGSVTSVISYDEHFIAFDTDISINQIFEADVAFGIRTRRRTWVDGVKTNDQYMNDYVDTQVTVSCEELTNANFIVPWEKPKTWKTIEKVSEFIAKESLSTEAKEKLADKQWVLRFLRTPYTYNVNGFPPFFTAELITEEVADETILRLNYEKDGKVYNLGVVDNKQSPAPDAPPDNGDPEKPSDIWEWLKDFLQRLFKGDLKWWEWIIVALAVPVLILVIVLIIYLFPLIVQIGKSIIWLFITPFKLLGKAIQSASRRREKRKRAKAQKQKNKNPENNHENEKDEE